MIVDYRNAVGYFSQTIMKELHLVSRYDVLYGKVKEFISNYLFDQPVDIEDLNTLRNLSELEATKTIIQTFIKKIEEGFNKYMPETFTDLDKNFKKYRDG